MDRFSSLPDPVLLHILSFLPFDDVVRSTLLCRQCKSLWTLSSYLNFTHRPNDFPSIQKFVSFVDKSLLHVHSSKNLDKFHLDFPFKRCFTADVVVWVLFSLDRKVKELNLFLSNDARDEFLLPKRLLANYSVEKLSLRSCRFKKEHSVKWGSLKELRIGSAELGDDVVQHLALGCPALEYLELKDCWGFSRLDLASTNLEGLVVDGYAPVKAHLDDLLEIKAPSIKVLEIKGCFNRMKLELRNLFRCVVAKLNFYLTAPMNDEDEDYHENQLQMLINLLSSVRHAKDVMLGTWCVEVISTRGVNVLPFCLMNCKYLTLLTAIQERYLPGILVLLKCAPTSETLIIHLAPPYFEFESIQDEVCLSPNYGLPAETRASKHILSTGPRYFLKNIKIYGFEGMRSGQEILFMRYLLAKCPNLDKMIIEWRVGQQHPSCDLLDVHVTQCLLKSPRCSRDAVIEIRRH